MSKHICDEEFPCDDFAYSVGSHPSFKKSLRLRASARDFLGFFIHRKRILAQGRKGAGMKREFLNGMMAVNG